jgi:nucleoid-associated protein YgaU
MIDDWRNTGQPLRIIITDSNQGVDINMEVLVESFDKGMKGGSEGDVYYSITLKRYKRINVQEADSIYKPTITRSTPPGLQQQIAMDSTSKINTTGSKTTAISPETTHTVRDGETLWDIAKKYYGLGADWQKVYKANKDAMPDAISVEAGLKLRIPW